MLKLTAVITSTIKGRFQCAVPRNLFDIELEDVSTEKTAPLWERPTWRRTMKLGPNPEMALVIDARMLLLVLVRGKNL
jgi:hypothetical protein